MAYLLYASMYSEVIPLSDVTNFLNVLLFPVTVIIGKIFLGNPKLESYSYWAFPFNWAYWYLLSCFVANIYSKKGSK